MMTYITGSKPEYPWDKGCQEIEEEIIVLEVAERAKMIAQQDGHDFAFGHLPFAVSHALISLGYGAICRFLVNSESKFLQNSSNIQNISVTLSVVIIATYIL